MLFWDPDGLAKEKHGEKLEPGTVAYTLHYLRYAFSWKSSVSERFYETRDNASQTLQEAQNKTLNRKDQVVSMLENNHYELMAPGFDKFSKASDFYSDRALLWTLGARHGTLNFGESSVATASMAHNVLVLGVDQIGKVEPTISGQAAEELAPIVNMFTEKGVLSTMFEGAIQPFSSLMMNMMLAQNGSFQAEFDYFAGGTEMGIAFAPVILLGPQAAGSRVFRPGKFKRPKFTGLHKEKVKSFVKKSKNAMSKFVSKGYNFHQLDLPEIFSSQKGLRNASQIDGIKDAMVKGKFKYESLDGRICVFRNCRGEISVSDGNHRVVAAIELAAETGNTDFINSLLQHAKIDYVDEFYVTYKLHQR